MHIETDLVSILENIGESLFTAVNPDGNAVEGMSFDADIERFGRKAKNLDWWMIEAWNAWPCGEAPLPLRGEFEWSADEMPAPSAGRKRPGAPFSRL